MVSTTAQPGKVVTTVNVDYMAKCSNSYNLSVKETIEPVGDINFIDDRFALTTLTYTA